MWNLLPLLGNLIENGAGSLTAKKPVAKQTIAKQASTPGIIKNNHSSSQQQGNQYNQHIQQPAKRHQYKRQQYIQQQGNQQHIQQQGNQQVIQQHNQQVIQQHNQQVIQQHNKKTSADLAGVQDNSLDGENILEYKFKKEEFTFKLMDLLMKKLKKGFIQQLEKRPALFKYNILWNLQYSNKYKTIFDALVDYIDSKTRTKQKYLKYKSKYIALKRLIMLGVN
jgi:hypothetical protein